MFSEPQVPFPAVTFCNLNPFKKTMVQHSQELTNLIAAYTYVNKVKQARMKSGTTAVATTTTAAGIDSHARKKRQARPPSTDGCTETTYPFPYCPTPKQYSVWACPDGNASVVFK
ncbi:hypothetical protein AAVH_40126, partial [Aphelenchoides avenae]